MPRTQTEYERFTEWLGSAECGEYLRRCKAEDESEKQQERRRLRNEIARHLWRVHDLRMELAELES